MSNSNSNFSTVGTTTQGQNIGVGAGIFAQKEGVTLQFKTICSEGGTVAITVEDNQINLESTPTGVGSAAGNQTEVQFNTGGLLDADSGFTFDKSTTILTLGDNSCFDAGTTPFLRLDTTNFWNAQTCSLQIGAGAIICGTNNSIRIGSGTINGSCAAGFGYGISADGNNSFAAGCCATANGFASVALGNKICVDGDSSFAGGNGGALRPVYVSANCSFNWSSNNASHVNGDGVKAPYSAILGGCNHNIESANSGSTILGGCEICLDGSSYVNTTAVGCLAIFQTPAAGSTEDVLTWNPTTKKINKVAQSSITGTPPDLQDVTDEGNTTDNQIISTVTTGTAPFSVASTTTVSNLSADLLDGISSGSFLRSDQADIKTSGDLQFSDTICATFGSGNDLRIYHNGSNSLIDNVTGNLALRVATSENAVVAQPNSCVSLYFNGVEKIKTLTDGGCVAGSLFATTCIDTPHACLTSMCFNDGNQTDGYVLKSDASGNASWQPSADPTALKVFYVDGNNPDVGDGSILNPFQTIDLAFDTVCGSGTRGNPEYDGVAISIAGYDNYTTTCNLWLSNTTYDFQPGAILCYDSTGYLFDTEGFLTDNRKHEVKVLGNAEIVLSTGGVANIVGVDSNTPNGEGVGLVMEVERISHSYDDPSTSEKYISFRARNTGSTAINHFRTNIDLRILNTFFSDSQTPFYIEGRGNVEVNGGRISAGGTSASDNHSANLRIFKAGDVNNLRVKDTNLALRYGQYFFEISGETTLWEVSNVTYQGSDTLSTGPLGVIQLNSGFKMGQNGDTTRKPRAAISMNYLSGFWSGGFNGSFIDNNTGSPLTSDTWSGFTIYDTTTPVKLDSNALDIKGSCGIISNFTYHPDGSTARSLSQFESIGLACHELYIDSSCNLQIKRGTSCLIDFDASNSCYTYYYGGTERFNLNKTGTQFACSVFLEGTNCVAFGTGSPLKLCTNDSTVAYMCALSQVMCINSSSCVAVGQSNSTKMCTKTTGICVLGNVTCSSDGRLKEVVGNIDNPLEITKNLCAVKYKNKLQDDNCVHLGYIAQEVQSILPEVVDYGTIGEEDNTYESVGITDGVYGIDYSAIVPVLSEAIKCQQTCIESLEERISKLENN